MTSPHILLLLLRLVRFPLAIWAVISLQASAGPAAEAFAQQKQFSPLDRQLLEDPPEPLENQSQEADMEKELKAMGKRLHRELGPGAVPEDEHPLLQISRQMREAGALLALADVGPKTQEAQAAAIAGLEWLIQQAHKMRRSPSGSPSQQASVRSASGGQGTQPDDSQQAPGEQPQPKTLVSSPAAQTKPLSQEQLQDLMRKVPWGDLPQRVREELLQLPPEEFLPKYQLLIEQYYRRLALEGEPGP
jgi:hypothetical protein